MKTDKIIPKINENLVLIAIFLYFSGYLYIYYFYFYFGISLGELEPAFYSYLIYSFNIFRNQTVEIIVVIGLLTIFYVLINKYKKDFLRLYRFLYLLALIPVLFFLARDSAEKEVMKTRTQKNGRQIRFFMEPTYTSKSKLFKVRNESDELYLLAENEESYFVFYQKVPSERRALPEALVFHVSKEDVSMVEIRIAPY